MKKCINCGASISNDYKFCPKCGVNQSIELVEIENDNENEVKSSSKGISCLVGIIILIILLILSGIGLYLYNNGFYKLHEKNENETDSIVAIADTVEIAKGMPASLLLDGSMSSGEIITIDVNISSSGKVEGVYYNRNKQGSFKVKGNGDNKSGIIKIEVPEVALNIEMKPSEGNNGTYDGFWEDKTSRGTIYFYEASGRHLQPFVDTIPQFVSKREFTDNVNNSGTRLVGTFNGKNKVEIILTNLETGEGEYCSDEQGKKLRMKLKCKKDLDGEWTMMLQNSSGVVNGCFIGKFIEGNFVGKFYDDKGGEQKVKLKQI